MGLDMYARTLKEEPSSPVDFIGENDDVGEELFYWRKHPNMHGWMENLYRSKGGTDEDFNISPVLLTSDDLDALEKAVNDGALPETHGFFFGSSTPENREDDLKFIAAAREAIANGLHVYYTSWW